MRDARLDIQEALNEPLDAIPVRSGRKSVLAAAVVSIALLAVGLAALYLRNTATPREMRLQIETPSTPSPLDFALSPDGQYIAFIASGRGPQRLWIRALNKTDAQAIPGTEGANNPFWSPDSHSVGYFALTRLWRVDIAGGPPQQLATATSGRGGTWNAEGTILFAPAVNTPVSRISATGGEVAAVTRLDPPRQVSHIFPQSLPDGRHFLFYAVGDADVAGIYLGSLAGEEPKRLTAADTAGTYLPPDRLVFVRQGALVAQRLDFKRAQLIGEAATLADRVGSYGAQGGFSISLDGRIAYRAGAPGRRQLIWFDRSGTSLGDASAPDANNLSNPELSTDGRYVSVTRLVENNPDVWLIDTLRGGWNRFTFDAAADQFAVWSPDSSQIVFASNRKTGMVSTYLKDGTNNLFVKPSSGATEEALLLDTPGGAIPQDWSKDGRFLLYFENQPKTKSDLLALDMTSKDPKRLVVANSPFSERIAQFSPDGRWVAYETNESGRFEIVAQSFPEPRGKWQVSTGGGFQPRWSANGKEIYFIAPDAKLMAAPIVVRSRPDPIFEAGKPVSLFQTRIVGAGVVNNVKPQYAVSRDGRFLINETVEEPNPPPITLILNWNSKP